MAKAKTQPADSLAVVKKDASQVVLHASNLVITSQAQLEEATEFLSTVKSAMKRIKEEKDKVLKPLLAAVDAERDRWRQIEQQTTDAEKIVKGKMETFIEKQKAEAEAQQAKLQKKFEKGEIKKEGTLARKMSMIEAPTKSVSTASGASIKTREIDVFHYDVELIPREYLLPNEALIKAAIKSGKVITGVTVTKKTTIAAR